MTRRHSIASDSYDGLILDAGAVYKDFVSVDSPGTLIGATRGGAVFKRVPTYLDLSYEGIPGQVAGQKHLTGVKVSIEVNIISFDEVNLALAIPNSLVTDLFDDNYFQITETEWDASAVHVANNVAIIAQLSGSTNPVVIVIDNPMCENDLTLTFKDKSEAVSKWIFSAFYDESAGFGTPPWRILWPGALRTVVAVADSTAGIAVSTDSGATWSAVAGAMPAASNRVYLAYHHGIYMAVIYGTVFAYSTDGTNWTESGALPASKSWASVAYSNGTWVAVSYSADDVAAYSLDDGVTWSAATMPTGDRYTGVVYGGGYFVAVSYSSGVSAYSADGITWTAGGSITNIPFSSAAYGGGTFVAVPSLSSDVVSYSTDNGITWAQGSLPFAGNWLSVTYGGGLFVAVGQNSAYAAYSSDGINWSQSDMPSSQPWYEVTYTNGVFVAVARAVTVAAYSADGINWTASTMPDNSNWIAVA